MSKQIYKHSSKLVRIDAGLHKMLKLMAVQQETTIKTLIDDLVRELIGPVSHEDK